MASRPQPEGDADAGGRSFRGHGESLRGHGDAGWSLRGHDKQRGTMMQGPARESYLAAREGLDRFAIDAEAERIATVADEILTFARLLGREPRLRRALIDASRTGSERAELLRTLLAGKVSDEAVDLLATLVGGRFGVPSELLNATEVLGVDGLLASAERAGVLGDVEDELFRFGQIVAGDRALAAALTDSSVDAERRAELVRSILADKAKPVTVRLAEVALGRFGGRAFQAGLTRLVELAAERREATVAYVTAAVMLTEDEQRTLLDRLSRLYRRTVSLKIEVEPQIIGGMSVRVGSDLYDGTVARRLAEARAALAK